MTLDEYIADPGRKKALAEACKTSPAYLWQLAVAWGGRRPSPEMAKAIARESARLGPAPVTKESLRPDLWGEEAAA